jgi:hypothetical protein
MSSEDDLAYRRSVRNMSIILAVIVIVVFAAIFVPPYISPYHEVFQQSVSLDSPAGFTMHLTINATTILPVGSVLMDGWVNSTFASVGNLTVADQWAFQQSLLWGNDCASGWPIGIGVMEGHYTQDNYTLGTLLSMQQPLIRCPVSAPPQFILLYPSPHSSEALASVNGNPVRWLLQTELTFSDGTLGQASQPGSQGAGELPPGVYTVVLADEWGDVLTNNFIVS